MTVSDHVVTAIEKVLTKTPAMYRYTEVLPKSFLASKSHYSWKQEDIFNREPIRRFALGFVSNKVFLGSAMTNPFHNKDFNLTSITVYRNGIPFVGTPMDTKGKKNMPF